MTSTPDNFIKDICRAVGHDFSPDNRFGSVCARCGEQEISALIRDRLAYSFVGQPINSRTVAALGAAAQAHLKDALVDGRIDGYTNVEACVDSQNPGACILKYSIKLPYSLEYMQVQARIW